MLGQKREKWEKLSQKIGQFFVGIPITPNGYTISSLFFIFLSLYFLIRYNFVLATLFFIISGFLDLVDGAVARSTRKITRLGAYLDTICDRYVETTILIGFLFLPLPEVLLPSYVWVFLALVGSLMTSYSKAAAKEKELIKEELKGGLFERGERFFLIVLTLVIASIELRFSIYSLIVLAIFSNISALQRVYFVVRSQPR